MLDARSQSQSKGIGFASLAGTFGSALNPGIAMYRLFDTISLILLLEKTLSNT